MPFWTVVEGKIFVWFILDVEEILSLVMWGKYSICPLSVAMSSSWLSNVIVLKNYKYTDNVEDLENTGRKLLFWILHRPLHALIFCFCKQVVVASAVYFKMGMFLKRLGWAFLLFMGIFLRKQQNKWEAEEKFWRLKMVNLTVSTACHSPCKSCPHKFYL